MPAQDTDTNWILPDQVFDGLELSNNIAIGWRAGQVVEIVSAQALPRNVAPQRIAGVVSPGFVDLQVNGGNGVLFNLNPTLNGIKSIEAAHRKFGTVRLLPTLITDAPHILEKAVDAILGSVSEPAIMGMHIEGPHISATRKGTHAEEFVRPLDAKTIAQVKRLRKHNIPVMITLAPEAASDEDISRLTALGVVVSIGHSDATAEKTNAALRAGANCFTHLFNAMSPMQGREPGVVGAAINSEAHVGIICDGIHVDDEMVGLAIRARPIPDRIFLVSDAMPSVGGDSEFELYGTTVTLKDGRLINQHGNLAGAHTTMFHSLHRLVSCVGVELESALRMATCIPLNLMQGGRDISPYLVGQNTSDVVVFDEKFTSIKYLPSALD